MVRVSGKIRQILVDRGLIGPDDWEKARESGSGPLEEIVRRGTVDERALLDAIGRSSGIPPIDLSRVEPDPSAVECLSQETCSEFGIVPISRNGAVLTIAVADPFDVLLFDDLRSRTGCRVHLVLSHPALIKTALERVYQTGRREVDELLGQVTDSAAEIDTREKEDERDLDISTAVGDDAPAVKLTNMLLVRALKEKASDIHIEPTDRDIVVRLRIDGCLRIIMTPPKALLNALISRLKILAKLDIAERFSPQDGKFQIRFEGRQIDFRLSILPVVGGEKAVIRILDAGSTALKLETMGYEPQSLEHIRQAIHAPYGMLLVTGPTGSGKSTTLYSCVQEVSSPEINLTTVEDPVEYRMQGVNQVSVNPKRGMTFAGALRSILRQDPDVILLGEIRDRETADIAVKAALTGHLLLSTLHTNDAASSVTRLVDMGIDPFMVSSSILCIGAQRLARTLCPQCRVEVEVPAGRLVQVGCLPEEVETGQFFAPNPSGCSRCSQGYRGRFAILETFYFDETLKRMVVEGRSAQDIKAEAVRQGMLTLRRVGLLNAMRGRTSLEEVLRVTLADDARSA